MERLVLLWLWNTVGSAGLGRARPGLVGLGRARPGLAGLGRGPPWGGASLNTPYKSTIPNILRGHTTFYDQ